MNFKVIQHAVLLFLFFALQTFVAQDYKRIDSLRKQIALKNDTDTMKSKLMGSLAFEYSYIDLDSGMVLAQKALSLANQNNHKRNKIHLYNVIGTIYEDKADYKAAIEVYTEALKLADYYGNKRALAVIYANLGNTYSEMKDYKTSLSFEIEANRIYHELNITERYAGAYLNLGGSYQINQQIDSAIKYYNLCLSTPSKNENAYAQAHIYKSSCFRMLKKYDLAKKECEQVAVLLKKINSDYFYYDYLTELGSLYFDTKEYDKAESAFLQCLEYQKKASLKGHEAATYIKLFELYDNKKDYKLALKYHLLYTSLKDSINNIETIKNAKEVEKKYQAERKQSQIEKLNIEKVASNAEIKQKEQFLIFAIIGCVLVLIVLGFAVYAFINKRKANIELQALHEEVSLQKNELFDKNKNITDSILYAQRIQKALLTSHSYIKKNIPEFFIINKPKDIVSGDFYWAVQSENKFYFMLADCTGHGVPGAFMSLLGISFLNELVVSQGLKQPNIIVNRLREEIINVLNDQDENAYQMKDGMDGVLCQFDFKNLVLEYTAANNKIVVIRHGAIIDLKGENMPIGKSPKDHESFNKHTFALQKNDLIYLFTDGFPDQFGGDKGKKLKEKSLKELLLKHSTSSLSAQEKTLSAYFEQWKGNLEQVDDVCLVGFKI